MKYFSILVVLIFFQAQAVTLTPGNRLEVNTTISGTINIPTCTINGTYSLNQKVFLGAYTEDDLSDNTTREILVPMNIDCGGGGGGGYVSNVFFTYQRVMSDDSNASDSDYIVTDKDNIVIYLSWNDDLMTSSVFDETQIRSLGNNLYDASLKARVRLLDTADDVLEGTNFESFMNFEIRYE